MGKDFESGCLDSDWFGGGNWILKGEGFQVADQLFIQISHQQLCHAQGLR
jgi:hypothetical protein